MVTVLMKCLRFTQIIKFIIIKMVRKKKVSKKTNHLAVRLFVPFAIVFGLSMTFLTPPFQAPDEPAHFFRAYQVSDFNFSPVVKNNATGGYLPKSLMITLDILNPGKPDYGTEDYYQRFREALALPLNRTERNLLFFPNMALYAPVLYFPQSAGILIGKLFNLSPLYLLYLARLFNLFFWVFLISLAIRWIPFYKWLFAALSIMPMSVFLAGSANADALVMAYPFLFLAYVLKIAFDEQSTLNWKNLLVLTFLSILVALSKNIYVLMSGLVFIIPASKAKGRKDYVMKLSIYFGFTLTTAAISYFMVQNILNKVEIIELYYGGAPAPLINPEKQIDYILSDIPGFLSMVFLSFLEKLSIILKSYVGILGWLQIIFPNAYYIFACMVLLMLAIFGEQKKKSIGIKRKVLMVLILLATILAFSFTMYCSWCEPGASRIHNLQGRYFITVAPLAWLVFQNKKLYLPPKSLSVIFVAFAAINTTISVWILLSYFYF